MYRHLFLWICCLTFWTPSRSSDPLHLTPYLERGDITTALKLSEVRDLNQIIPRSYAGFITADKKLGNHLFFWFFPAVSEPQAPILVWLNGGPAITSMLGLLWENGPIRAVYENDKVTYKRWTKSWAESLAMLYIDNPVGTGYSYSDSGRNGWKTTADGYTEDLFSFITQFYILFPELLQRELYIGGQSYAGKFVPALAYRIHQEIQLNGSSLPLAGIYMGGPLFDPYTQGLAQGHFFYSLGVVSHAQFMNHKQIVEEMFTKNFTEQEKPFLTVWKQLSSVAYIMDNYDTREETGYNPVHVLMTSPHFRKAVHVGNNLNFSAINYDLNSKYGHDCLLSTKPKLAELMNHYKVLIYNGDFDGIISSPMIEEAILSTRWSGQAEYNNSDRFQWWDLNSFQLMGFYTQVGNFCRVIIYKAGHQTPYDQPDSTREMMLQFVRHGCVTTKLRVLFNATSTTAPESTSRWKDLQNSGTRPVGFQMLIIFAVIYPAVRCQFPSSCCTR